MKGKKVAVIAPMQKANGIGESNSLSTDTEEQDDSQLLTSSYEGILTNLSHFFNQNFCYELYHLNLE